MEVILHPYTLQLKYTFTISRESHDTQDTLIVELKEGDISGYGEATSNPYYGKTIASMSQHIQKAIDTIKAANGSSPEDFWKALYPHFKEDMFALCALDLAYNDLYAKKAGEKLYELWGYTPENNPKTDYTIGIDTIEKMVAKLTELPWPIYKIKLGTPNDIAIVKELRKHTDAVFRVDANCGWGVEETIHNSVELKKLGVEFIEQPLKADDWEGHREVFLKSALPIIADESCQVEADVAKCHNHFHGVNVKLTKCGGLTPGRRMLLHAKELGMNTMVGCMTESSVGISAIAHLLPLLDYVDMDGQLLLAKDIASGITLQDGVIHYSKVNGIGVELL